MGDFDEDEKRCLFFLVNIDLGDTLTEVLVPGVVVIVVVAAIIIIIL